MLNLPVDHAEFMRLYFEQQPLICPAAIASDKVGWSDLDNVLQFLEPDPAVLQLFLNGQIDPARYSIEKLQTGKHVRLLNRLPFYDLLQRGATLLSYMDEDIGQAAATKGDLPPFGGNFYDRRSADGATQGPRIPLDGPTGNRNMFGVDRFLFHEDLIGPGF